MRATQNLSPRNPTKDHVRPGPFLRHRIGPRCRPKAGEPARKTTAGFDPDEWLAWADRLKANGETVTSTRAVADGLAPSTTTAKRRLHTLRREHPGRF